MSLAVFTQICMHYNKSAARSSCSIFLVNEMWLHIPSSACICFYNIEIFQLFNYAPCFIQSFSGHLATTGASTNAKHLEKTRGALPQGLWLILMLSSSRPCFFLLTGCTMSLDKHKVLLFTGIHLQERWAPRRRIVSLGAQIPHSKCHKVSVQTVREFEKKRSLSEGFRLDCYYLAEPEEDKEKRFLAWRRWGVTALGSSRQR